jgi:hypothetical protein
MAAAYFFKHRDFHSVIIILDGNLSKNKTKNKTKYMHQSPMFQLPAVNFNLKILMEIPEINKIHKFKIARCSE